MSEFARARITVEGIVQGVGFRPFVHRLAGRLQLGGWARNTADGVELLLEGTPAALRAFAAALRDPARLPPLAAVDRVTLGTLQPLPAGQTPSRAFVIRPSAPGAHNTLVSPDVATCPDCLRELRDPANRRWRYPFLNCTNCGPRFTILKSIPYDRAGTTMAKFALCPACAAEYAAITNRRYHAQPNCCPACGPRLWFADAAGREQRGDPIAAAQALLRAGGIVAVKGLGGFHLACLARPAPVALLRRRKHREQKPLAVMVPDAAAAKALCLVSEAEAAALQSPRAPILLLRKRPGMQLGHLSRTAELGVMLPYTPLHHLLFAPLPGAAPASGPAFPALVMTSANPSSLPAVLSNEQALAQLSGIADGFLLHDRAIEARCDDSLLRLLPPEADAAFAAPADPGPAYFIRRSRGYAPQPIPTGFSCTGILALGAEQKASFALGKGRSAFYSQHIGDLKNAETLAHYQSQIERFERLFGVRPARLVCDLHPDFLSTRYARARAAAEGLPLLQVQHHHAHMAACMADNALPADARCIGLVWDGTGLGADGAIWGGEVFTGGYGGVARAASVRPIPLPGGDAAVTEIARIAFALTQDAGLPYAGPLPAQKQAVLAAMLQRGVNCPPSSGMGRLFDGVYSLLTGCERAGYEGEAAVLLEALAQQAPGERAAYPVEFYTDPADALPRLDTRPILRALAAGLAAGQSPQVLAARFHNTLIGFAAEACARARAATGLTQVVLSGGVFFNQILLHGVAARLKAAGFTVYRHRRVSPGDEGLALGQLAVSALAK